MKKTLAFAAAVLASSILAPAAQAVGLQPRAWVSIQGVDAAGCGIGSNPCRTFQYAHDNIVAGGGTIYVHDVGNYGQIVITQPISIINDGVGDVTIFAASGDAIDIRAGATDEIFIKGLILDGVAGTSGNGIDLTSAGNLTVADCTIKGFLGQGPKGNGVLIDPPSGNVRFTISDTIVTRNGVGIYVIPALRDLQSGFGFQSGSSASVTGNITRAEVTANTTGVVANGGYTSGTTTVFANQVNASNNDTGFYDTTPSLYLTRSIVTGNRIIGVSIAGTVYSSGDNVINGNGGGDVSAPLSPVALK